MTILFGIVLLALVINVAVLLWALALDQWLEHRERAARKPPAVHAPAGAVKPSRPTYIVTPDSEIEPPSDAVEELP